MCTTSVKRHHCRRPADHNRRARPPTASFSLSPQDKRPHPSLRSHPSGHGEFNITSLTSGQCCLRSSTRWPVCGNLPSAALNYSSTTPPLSAWHAWRAQGSAYIRLSQPLQAGRPWAAKGGQAARASTYWRALSCVPVARMCPQ